MSTNRNRQMKDFCGFASAGLTEQNRSPSGLFRYKPARSSIPRYLKIAVPGDPQIAGDSYVHQS